MDYSLTCLQHIAVTIFPNTRYGNISHLVSLKLTMPVIRASDISASSVCGFRSRPTAGRELACFRLSSLTQPLCLLIQSAVPVVLPRCDDIFNPADATVQVIISTLEAVQCHAPRRRIGVIEFLLFFRLREQD